MRPDDPSRSVARGEPDRAVSAAGCETLAGVLARHARSRPDGTALRFLWDPRDATPSAPVTTTTYAGLLDGASRVAAALLEVCRPGDRAVLLYPPSPGYVEAFFGCVAAGVVAVPAYPPEGAASADRLTALVHDAGPTAFVTTTELLPACRGDDAPDGLRGLPGIATDGLDAAPGPAPRTHAAAGDIAFLQYTSGSTGHPRGVMVTHGSLAANLAAMTDRFAVTPADHEVSWLPPYHDMGLIAGILQPIASGVETTLMSPFAFLVDPLAWLEVISRYRATYCGAPNFAFDLCAHRADTERVAALDLSTWRLAFCGAEPIRVSAMRAFTGAFAPAGFDPGALLPAYGLAEVTLMATGQHTRQPVRAISLDGDLEPRRVLPAEPAASNEPAAAEPAAGEPGLPIGPAPAQLVCVGTTVAGVELRVVDPETCRPCRDGEVGEIWLTGPSLARGYFQRPDETRAAFAGAIDGEDPATRYLRTGDLGVIVDGELYVAGRIKDLVILRGRNLYPQDAEEVSWSVDARLRRGCAAAFGVDVDDAERLVVVQECRLDEPPEAAAELAQAVRRALNSALGVDVFEVVLVPRRTVPKTSSGKIRRRVTRDAYLDGRLPVLGRARLPASA